MSAARRCDWCEELVDAPQLRNQLVSRGKSGGKSFDFCSDECLRDWADERLERREVRRGLRQEYAACPATSGTGECVGHSGAAFPGDATGEHHVEPGSPFDMPRRVSA
jgi:hypothetical protein